MKKAPKIRKKYADGSTVDGNDPKKKVDPNSPVTVTAPSATTTDTAQITNGGQRMKMGWVTPPTPKNPNVDLSGSKFGILGAPVPKSEQADWSAKWGIDPTAHYKGTYPTYYAQKGNNYYQLTFDEYSKYKNAQGNGLSIPFTAPQQSAYFDQTAPYQRKAKGGKVKGYANGSVITDPNDPNYDPNLDPNSPSYDASLANANKKKGLDFANVSKALTGAGGYATLGQEAGNLVNNNIQLNKNEKGIVAKDALSTGLTDAGKFAAIGSLLGPEGTAIGAGVGLAYGAVTGAIKGKKQKNADASLQQQQMQEEGAMGSEIADYKGVQSDSIKKNNKFLGVFGNGGGVAMASSGPPESKPKEMFKKDGGAIEKEMGFAKGGLTSDKAKEILRDGTANGKALTAKQKRYMGWVAGGSKAEGGEIEGAGTGKSDSIYANIKPGSFVVPVESVKIAEHLRAMYLGGDDKKAKLKQGGGVPVKLSNGEHLFTPEEVVLLKAKGIDLDELAPNAVDEHGKAKGGPVTTDDLPDFDQLIAEADKEATTEKKGKADAKKLADIEAKKQKLVGYKQGLGELSNAVKSYLKGDRSEKTMATLGDVPEGEDPQTYYINNYRQQLNSFRDDVKSVGKIDFSKPNTVPTQKGTGLSNKVNKEVGNGTNITSRTLSTDKIKDKNTVNLNDTKTPEDALNKYYDTLNNSAPTPVVSTSDQPTVDKKNPDNPASEKPNTLAKFYDAIGGAGGVASAFQFGLGAEELAGSKKNMPKFGIGQNILHAEQNAFSESRYGLDPTEFAKVKADIALNRASTDKNIVNASGGNAAVALGNMSANNRQTSDALKNLAIGDKQVQMEKERYANALTQGIEQERMFKYQQDLNQFDKHQMAASALMGAGIENFVGGIENQNDINASDARAKKYGNVINLGS